MSLATKYRPRTWEDVTEQGLVIQMLKSMCESELPNRCFLLTGPAGTGKAQPLDSHVLTPNGFIEMRDVKVGTEVITGKGHVGKVSGIYPQGARPIYELVLSDGGSIRVADLHLNVVYVEGSISVVTTDYIVRLFGDGFNLSIPRADLSNYQYDTDDIPDTDEYRMIENIHYIGEEDCQCIMIDHEDHTYVSDDYILTHNTTTGRLIATYLNGSTDNLIEIDAASNNGVESMRNLVQQAETYPIGTKYKIILVDECFHGDTLITTRNGCKPIRMICVGDEVVNMYGVSTVTHVVKNRVFTDRLCCVIINGVKTYTTSDHLYFTNLGWVEAQNLKNGDIVYAPTYLRSLWEDIFQQTEESEILLQYLCKTCNERGISSETSEQPCYKILCDLWETIFSATFGQEEDLLDRVQGKIHKYSREGCIGKYRTWENFKAEIVKTNVGKESYERSKYITEDDRHSQIKWYLECLVGSAWWERSIYDTTTRIMGSVGEETDIRISNTDKDSEGIWVSYLLQSRPRLSRTNACDRGGWEESPLESFFCKGRKENKMLDVFRVESSEVYKQGYNDELFRSGFSDSELHSRYVTMYDLEVSNHHSYFANGVLVHNCHVLSPQAWQVLLKTFEEQPAKTVFIACTTNPEKIPDTILSRVQSFQLSKISLEGIKDRLKFVMDSEIAEGQKYTYTDDAILYISKLSNGGMRDSLTLLEKSIAYSPNVTTENVVKALNLPNYDDYFKLLGAYAKKDNAKIADIVDSVYNSGVNFQKWFEGFHSFVMNVVKYIYLQDIQKTTVPSYYSDKISKYGTNHVIICLKLANRLVDLNSALKSTQYLQETTLTYLCTIPKAGV